MQLAALPLTEWARKGFAEGRKDGHDDSDIAKWVTAYGRRVER